MKSLANKMLIILIASLPACATFTTKKADLDKKPDGVRVYPQKFYLFVDAGAGETGAGQSLLVTLPDYGRAYDIKPLTVLAKQDFTLKLGDSGQLSELTSNQDTTGILTFLKDAGQMAAKGAGIGVSSQSIAGTFGLRSGIYVLSDDGSFVPVRN